MIFSRINALLTRTWFPEPNLAVAEQVVLDVRDKRKRHMITKLKQAIHTVADIKQDVKNLSDDINRLNQDTRIYEQLIRRTRT